jgi:hypothetical protein
MVSRFRRPSRKRSSKSRCEPSCCLFRCRRRRGQSFQQNWLCIQSSNWKPYHCATFVRTPNHSSKSSRIGQRNTACVNPRSWLNERTIRRITLINWKSTTSLVITLPALISPRVSFVCVAVSETLKRLPYEHQELSAPVRKQTHRAGEIPCVPYAAASRADRS